MASDVTDPVRIFVACTPNGEDLEQQAVHAYTLHRMCSRPYELRWLKLDNDKGSALRYTKFATAGWSTNFSGLRWLVPDLCEYEGKAIYCDVDTWWERDPCELWDQPHDGAALMAAGNYGKPSYGVLFWDCAAAKGHIQSKPEKTDYMGANTAYFRAAGAPVVKKWEGDWNCLDGGKYESVTDPRIGLHHATAMSTQPGHKYALPRLAAEGRKHWYDGEIRPHPRPDYQERFDSLLRQAISFDFTPERYKPTGPLLHFHKKSYRGK